MSANNSAAPVTAPPLDVLSGSPPASPADRLAATTQPHHARRLRRTLAIAAVAVLAIAGLVTWRAAAPPVPIHYITAPVTRGDVRRTVTASGTVNPVITIQVGTYVSGVIQQLYCDYNTQVHKGQLCAKIDPRPYQTAVDQTRASLSTARAQLAKDQAALTYARLAYDRASKQSGIIAAEMIDSAKSVADQALAQVELDQATVQERQAALDAATINLQYTNIISPVNGTVVSRNVTMGQTVAASFQTPTLFLIATDLTKMQVDTNVSESDIGGIAAGNLTTFTVEAFPNHPFQGEVTQVRQAPQTVQNVVTYDVVINVQNPDLLLKPGMTATVRVVTDRRANVLRVPDPALRYVPSSLAPRPATTAGRPNAASPHVWVLRSGVPTAVEVTTGLDDDTNVEILGGDLKPGDEVVTGEQNGAGSAPSRLSFFRL